MFGRRLTIIVACIGGGALVYPYCFTRNTGVIGAAFWQQFFVQGAWGVIPIHLVELAPAGARTTIVGTSYQLGNLASSASSTIEAKMGERFRLSGSGLSTRYNYGLVMSIFMGCVFGYVIVLTFLGPEKLGRDMAESTTADAFDNVGGVKNGSGDWEDGKAVAVESEEKGNVDISRV